MPAHAQWLEELLNLSIDEAAAAAVADEHAAAERAVELAHAALDAAENELEPARRWLAIARAVADKGDPTAVVAGWLAFAQARIAVHVGDLSGAETALIEAQRAWQAVDDGKHIPRTWLGLTQVLAMQGRYAEAESAVRMALAQLETPDLDFDGHLRSAGARHNLATLFVMQDRHDAALAEYGAAERWLTALTPMTTDEIDEVTVELAHNALNRASALTFLDQPAVAEQNLQRAIELFSQLGDAANRGRARTNLGRLLLRTGRYTEALDAFGAATQDLLGVASSELAPDDDRLRQADELLLEHATAYLALNLLPEARDILGRCEVLFRSSGQLYELGQTLVTLGQVQMRLNLLADAEVTLDQALDLFSRLGNLFWRNRSEVALAALEQRRGQGQRAADRLDRIMDAAGSLDAAGMAWDMHGLAEARLLAARIATEQGDLALATRLALAAADDAGAPLTLDAPPQPVLPTVAVRAYGLLGKCARLAGNRAEAQRLLLIAADLLEQQRAGLPVEEIRAAFVDDKLDVYSDLLLTLLDAPAPSDDDLAAAFAAVERGRARAMLERMLAVINIDAPPLDVSPAAALGQVELEAARQRLHWLYNQLLGESGSRQVDVARSRELQAQEAIVRSLEWQQSPLLTQTQPADLIAFQAMLDPDQQALIYAIAGDELLLFVVAQTQITVARNLTTMTSLVELLGSLQFELGRASMGAEYLMRHGPRLERSLKIALQRLHSVLIAPVQELLPAARLLIIPAGPMHRLPFHALWDGAAYLLERFECTVAPSAGAAIQCSAVRNADRRYASWAGLALSDPSIPAARQEVEAVAPCFADARLFVDDAASRAGLRSAAQADVLHMATHGLFRPDNPFFSVLKLADGWIDVREIYRLPLRARLVVLSACESGVGHVGGGDEVIGLARGFLGAGAAELVVSLWQVHDASAALFMRRFYEALTAPGQPVRAAQALRTAQLAAVAAGVHPHFWAPFFVIGG